MSIMKTLLLISMLFLLSCCNNKIDIESMAKEQAEKTMKEFARNPESISISKMETIFKTDSTCVLHFIQRGQNGFGGYSIEKIEYMYCIQKSGRTYECVIDLNYTGSKFKQFMDFGTKIELKSNGEIKPDDMTNWLIGSIGIYTAVNGRLIEQQ